MKQQTKLQAEARQGGVTAIRSNKNVPGVLYGHGLTSEALQVNAQEFEKVFAVVGNTSLVSLLFGKTEHPVIVREVQHHPLKGTTQHVDFYQVRLDEAIKAEVPLVVVGESSAVKDLGGVLVRNLDELAVEALPKDLPHNIEVNISSIDNFEKVIRVKDITLPEGVKTSVDPDVVAILVQPPRSEEELEALTAEVKEDVQAVEGMKTKAEVEKEAEAAGGGAAPEAKTDDKKPETKK